MLESLRQQMMESMGMKILLPRFRLPAAKQSATLSQSDLIPETRLLSLSEKEPVLAQELGAAPTPLSLEGYSEDSPMDQSLDSGVQQKRSLPASFAQELNALDDIKNTLQSAGQLKEKPVKFRYRLVRVGELLMLLDQPTIEWQESEEARQFFADIYFALTDKKPEYLAEVQFDWPPSKQFPYAHDKEMARQTLHSFMQEQMRQPPCAWILVWGPQLADNVFEQLPKVGEVGFVNEVSVLLLDPIQHYWQMPSSKRLLWQSLQTVKKSLKSRSGNV